MSLQKERGREGGRRRMEGREGEREAREGERGGGEGAGELLLLAIPM